MLKQEVLQLINIRQEGPYWDFKREWYKKDKKSDMLHDIICMSNNLENRDGYIIIGIDEEDDYKSINIKDDANRRNTQMIVDFLKDKKFAGGVRPTVYVKSIYLGTDQVDIIVIRNGYDTPYYLTERFQEVAANNIYSRIMDTNTPINKSADLHHLEYLWKKRFRLISTPLERVKYYLNRPGEWLDSPTDWSTLKKYHKYFPEFIIEHTLDGDDDGYQYYLFNQTDINPRWREIRIFYHQTLLFSLEGVSLDGGRYFTPTPTSDGISLGEYQNWDISFKYFTKDALKYTIHKFYYEPDGDEATTSYRKFKECILIFENDCEKDSFKEYVLNNWVHKERFSENVRLPYFPEIEGYIMDEFEKQYKNVQILKRMLVEFKRR